MSRIRDKNDRKKNLVIKMLDSENLTKLVRICLEKVFIHPVSLELIWKELRDKSFLDIMEHDFAGTELYNVMENLEWDTVLYEQHVLKMIAPREEYDFDSIEIFKIFGITRDDFRLLVNTIDGITLRTITNGVYRMKINKYDLTNEKLSELEFGVKDDSLIMVARFEYEDS